jgi:hypothetical protein
MSMKGSLGGPPAQTTCWRGFRELNKAARWKEPPDKAYFADGTPGGSALLCFICVAFAALFLGYLTHNEGVSVITIRVDALWIAAFVGTVWGAKSAFGKNAQ